MSQLSIKSFFTSSPRAAKRSVEEDVVIAGGDQSDQKKIKSSLYDVDYRLIEQCSKTPALCSNIGKSWFVALESEFKKDYFLKLNEFICKERKCSIVYPPENQVYTWTRMFEIKETKVVIIGQDPYHNPSEAHGLSFSVPKGVRMPPSLMNIFKELETDIDGFVKPNHGCLEGWAKQGVLLLNSTLTVRKNEPMSHADKGWDQLTDAVIKWINNNLTNVVFILWGAKAQNKGSFLNKKKHVLLTSAHPSPLSAHRGFFGCKHFSKTNNYLSKMAKPIIDWSKLN